MVSKKKNSKNKRMPIFTKEMEQEPKLDECSEIFRMSEENHFTEGSDTEEEEFGLSLSESSEFDYRKYKTGLADILNEDLRIKGSLINYTELSCTTGENGCCHWVFPDDTFCNKKVSFFDEFEENIERRVALCEEIRSLPSAEFLACKYKLNEEIRAFDRSCLKYAERSHYWRDFKALFGL